MKVMKATRSVTISLIATAVLLGPASRAARADSVVQIPLAGVLDARSVTTLTNGNIVVFNLTIDGGGGDIGTGGLQNGFATKAVAMMKSPGNVANSLPDDGHFPMDTRHPEVVLNFSNTADPASSQTHLVKPTAGTFTFPVPSATYSKLFLFFHAANGGTMVTLTLTYSDATTSVTTAMIPDFFSDPSDTKVFVLAGNLAKWSKQTTIAEANHHNIFGVEVAPMAKTLTSVTVERAMNGFLTFWGATGVATSAVMGLPDGGADASGPADASGAAGGTAGASGNAGASGAAGTNGTAGASGAAGTNGGAAGGQTAGTTGTSTGVAGTNGAGTGGGAGTTSAGTAGAAGPHVPSSGGCSCQLGDVGTPRAPWLLLGVATSAWIGRRRLRRR